MRATQAMIALVAGLSVLTLVSGLAAQQSAPSATKLQRTDRTFITKAAEGGRREVELGQLAQGKASSDAVKQFAQRMVEDHGAANQELMQLADNKGVKLDNKGPKPDRELERLSKLQSPEFDREYVKAMVKDHKQDVADFKRMHSGAVDPNLKAWIDKTLPTLEDHLKTIEGIQAQMTAVKKK
jgi:putative membrane protein